MRDHRKLRAFELADRLALDIYAVTKRFPREEQFGLTSQMRRAAVSIVSNIVEGCGRRSEGDYIRFLDMANASARELEYQITLAERLGYLAESEAASVKERSQETNRVLAALVRSLVSANPKPEA